MFVKTLSELHEEYVGALAIAIYDLAQLNESIYEVSQKAQDLNNRLDQLDALKIEQLNLIDQFRSKIKELDSTKSEILNLAFFLLILLI